MGVNDYHISVYGHFHMEAIGGDPVLFEAKTACAVVAYFTLNRSRWVSRRDMAMEFWPDHDQASALTNLRTAMHRVRKALPHEGLIETEGEQVRLNVEGMESDVARADRLHRTFLLAANQPDGLEALIEEWSIRKRTLLEGWDFEWVDLLRVRAEVVANEVGCELAKTYEANGEFAKALGVWRQILERVPHHIEGLQHALRLEFQLNGKPKALELARTASHFYRGELGIEMPAELKKVLRAIHNGSLEVIPKPELIRTRNELLLLARMFESNLRSNRTEALAMLARECSTAGAYAHPKTMLSLLILALSQTEGDSIERLHVAAHACLLASWVSEFELGHKWADYVLERLPRDDAMMGTVASIKGFMHFEQRHYDPARQRLQETIEMLREQGRIAEMHRVSSRLAGVHWHCLDFDSAIESYNQLIDHCLAKPEEADPTSLPMAHGNLCYVYATCERWDDAIKHGRECSKVANERPIYSFVYPAPLGLALFAAGQEAEGLMELEKGVSATCREGMLRFNQIAIDLAAIVFYLTGNAARGRCVLQANSDHRTALQHYRSPAERRLIQSLTNVDPDVALSSEIANPLRGQTAGALSQWVCEELERLYRAAA